MQRTGFPRATRRQNPMEGMYRTLSARTNPTGKNRFEAGRKGIHSRDIDISRGMQSFRSTYIYYNFHFLSSVSWKITLGKIRVSNGNRIKEKFKKNEFYLNNTKQNVAIVMYIWVCMVTIAGWVYCNVLRRLLKFHGLDTSASFHV